MLRRVTRRRLTPPGAERLCWPSATCLSTRAFAPLFTGDSHGTVVPVLASRHFDGAAFPAAYEYSRSQDDLLEDASWHVPTSAVARFLGLCTRGGNTTPPTPPCHHAQRLCTPNGLQLWMVPKPTILLSILQAWVTARISSRAMSGERYSSMAILARSQDQACCFCMR